MLHVKNIHWHAEKTHILKGIDLTVENGQAVGIVWPNGCGKSSLLNTINGFNRSTAGKITFQHKDITNMTVEQRANEGIGRVFQSYGIFRQLSLYQNLALAFVQKLNWRQKLLPVSYLPKEYKNQIDMVLNQLDLYEKKDELAGNLSGGQMRLLEIGRLTLQDTKLYLLDEPTAGVSPKLKSTVIKLLHQIVESGKMVIIVEHDFGFLTEFVDKFYVLDDGQNVLEGDHKTIKDSPVIKDIYFG